MFALPVLSLYIFFGLGFEPAKLRATGPSVYPYTLYTLYTLLSDYHKTEVTLGQCSGPLYSEEGSLFLSLALTRTSCLHFV